MKTMLPMDGRFCFPEQKVYVSRHHQWAFAAWELGRMEGSLEPFATLIHVDAHLDDTWDGVTAEGLRQMANAEDVRAVAGKLEIDNFIWAGIATGTIGKIVYVCPKDVDPSDPFDLSGWDLNGVQLKPIRELLGSRPYTGCRFDSVEALQSHLAQGSANVNAMLGVPAGSVILDLDLDVFNRNQKTLDQPLLMPEFQIRAHLRYLRDLYDYDRITIALSPSFCGGEENCAILLDLLLEEFSLDLTKAVAW